MKPPPFEYAAPSSLDDVVSLLQEHDGEAKVLAGGQSLVPLLNMRLARPELLIDLSHVPDLDYIREADGAVAIGAMTRQRSVELSPVVQERHPLLLEATRNIAHPQNRNQGTVGGSLAHADPAGDYPALALALDAEFRAVGPDGARTVQADDFFVTYLTTSLGPAEILTEVRMPFLAARAGWSFKEFTRRRGDFAIAGAVTIVELDGARHCTQARIVLFGVGATPVRAKAAEQLLLGQELTEAVCEEAGRKASEDLDEPLTDVHATTEYRRDLSRVLTRRALLEAASRAGGTP